MKNKLFYLLIVGIIFILSSCGEPHTCQSCGGTFYDKGYTHMLGAPCPKVKTGQGQFCSSECCWK